MSLSQNFVPVFLALFLTTFAGCSKPEPTSSASGGSAGADKPLTIGVAFETLQTEYWVAGFEAIRADLKKRGYTMLEAVADGVAAGKQPHRSGAVDRFEAADNRQ